MESEFGAAAPAPVGGYGLDAQLGPMQATPPPLALQPAPPLSPQSRALTSARSPRGRSTPRGGGAMSPGGTSGSWRKVRSAVDTMGFIRRVGAMVGRVQLVNPVRPIRTNPPGDPTLAPIKGYPGFFNICFQMQRVALRRGCQRARLHPAGALAGPGALLRRRPGARGARGWQRDGGLRSQANHCGRGGRRGGRVRPRRGHDVHQGVGRALRRHGQGRQPRAAARLSLR